MQALKPVSFRKGREYKPRLSVPYVPGVRHERYWTDAEIAVIDKHYRKEGVAYCLALLPNRSLSALYGQAKKMNLAAPGRSTRAEPVGASLDDKIRAAWPTLAGRGAVSAFAASLGVKRHVVTKRAVVLGLTLPHKKETAWTVEELALLRRAPVNNPDRASAFFKAHGFSRSPTAIIVRCKRESISRRRLDILSARNVADILGIDSKSVAKLVVDGALKAERRGTSRLPQQGGDTYAIQPAELRRYILDNLELIDIRKVEKHSFVALLTAGAP